MPLASFLAWTLFLPAAIVIVNFVVGVMTPITFGPEDDMMLIDPVWRDVQRQHLGTDFHNPIGFGPFQLAAVIWRFLGPHYYVLRVSAELFALIIVLCSFLVARRQLRNAPGLAALFCITLAFEASGPSIPGFIHDFGMSLFYDRLLMSALLVLFVQSFANDSGHARHGRDYVDLFIAALLLNVLFLVKISGLVLGIAMVVGGRIVRGRSPRRLVDIALVLLLLGVLVALDFVITGTSFFPVIRDYGLAAQARVEALSVPDAFKFQLVSPVLEAVVLMVLYVISKPRRDDRGNLWRCFFILAFFSVSQLALNLTNSSDALLFLAPAAIIAVATWTDTPQTAVFWRHLWKRFDPFRLDEISLREAIPLLLIALVLVPEVFSSLIGFKRSYLISSGKAKPILVTANRGITFELLLSNPDFTDFVLSINRGIQAVGRLGVSHEKIANLDFTNPFPALLLSPAPRGVFVYWDFGKDVPLRYAPSWQEVIGDACIVTEPKQRVLDFSEPLLDAVQPHLASAFTLVYQDDMWKIWKSKGGCDATGASSN